uniref:Uncharacterized protein n=1 Tax=Rhizophora mucronata TaxID=61149 RepID=A0A2P2KY30_RHIMU
MASATGAMPETARLKSTANKEAPPTFIGKLRTASSFSATQSAIQSFLGFGPLNCEFEETLTGRRKFGK